MVGFDYCTADAVYLCVCGCKALCLLCQFPIGWDNDEQVDTVEGMKILMRHISNGLWGGEGGCGVDCHILVGEFSTGGGCFIGAASECACQFVGGCRGGDVPNASGGVGSLQFECAGAVAVGRERQIVPSVEGKCCLCCGADVVKVSGDARGTSVLQFDAE